MKPEDHQPRHPIAVVVQRTGLSPHTLRAWERRYGVVVPARSDGGHRLYSDDDVERLRLLHELTLGGRRISQIAERPSEELMELLREDRGDEATAPGRAARDGRGSARVDALLEAASAAVVALDAELLDRVLRRAALTLDLGTFTEDLVGPLLQEIGEDWAARRIRPAHEHLATSMIQRVSGWLLDHFEPPAGAPCLVAGTLPGQQHQLGAMGAALTAASEGWRVRYLGADLPAEEHAFAAREVSARAVVLSLIFPTDEPGTADELRRLRGALPPGLAILVGGRAAESYASVLDEIGARRLESLGALRPALAELVRSAS